MEEEYLDEKLYAYSQSNSYPFHMPGHKRIDSALTNPYQLDLTEIEGFDSLHQPKGILLQAKERLSRLYGSDESFYLVNGSSCGILAAISAAADPGETILLARNCHQSVYHAIFLRRLYPEYLYPANTKKGIAGCVDPKEVQKSLEHNPSIRAVVLTSPTYEGILSDIRTISQITHEKGIPLIVDEAHGAHLGFGKAFPPSAISQGADLVVQSFHKTLPSLTQTAVLHWMGERISLEKLEQYLRIYQTSSPSYLLMASIDRCVRMLMQEGEARFAAFAEKLDAFYQNMEGLEHLAIWRANDFTKEEAYAKDPSKILIGTGDSGFTGMELMDDLRNEYHIELEMASAHYALAMTSIMDTQEGFSRLADALYEIDRIAGKRSQKRKTTVNYEDLYGKKEVAYPFWSVEKMEKETVPLTQAAGRIARKQIYLYPPGIPLILPGERIDTAFLRGIEACLNAGLRPIGLDASERVEVLARDFS